MRRNNQWGLLAQTFSIVGGDQVNFEVASDPENPTLVSEFRLVRFAGILTWITADTWASALIQSPHVVIGLSISNQDVAQPARLGDGSDADKRFLAVQYEALVPASSSTAVDAHGNVKFDWQLRGGKGVLIRKDDSVTFSVFVNGPNTENHSMALYARGLFQL